MYQLNNQLILTHTWVFSIIPNRTIFHIIFTVVHTLRFTETSFCCFGHYYSGYTSTFQFDENLPGYRQWIYSLKAHLSLSCCPGRRIPMSTTLRRSTNLRLSVSDFTNGIIILSVTLVHPIDIFFRITRRTLKIRASVMRGDWHFCCLI